MVRSWIWIGLAFGPTAAAAQPRAVEAPPPKTAPATVGEVVVKGQNEATQMAIDRRSYSLAGDLQATAGSVADALRNVPSVSVDVQGNVALRGDSNVTILVDGKPSSLFQGPNKGLALQQMPADQVDRVEVMTNPSAEFRSDGAAGIINLVMRKAKGPGQSGVVRLSAGPGRRHGVSLQTGVNTPNLSFTGDLAYHHDTQKLESRDDRLQLDPMGLVFEESLDAEITRLHYDLLTARASLDVDIDPRTRLNGETHVNATTFDLATAGPTTRTAPLGQALQSFERLLQVGQTRANGEASVGLRRKLGDASALLTANLSHEETRDDGRRTGQTLDLFFAALPASDQQRTDVTLKRTEFKADYVRPSTGGVSLKAGLDVETDRNRYGNRGFLGGAPASLAPDPSLTDIFVFRQTLAQAYVTAERAAGPVTGLLGLRMENESLQLDSMASGVDARRREAHWLPSLHLAWKLSPQSQVTGSFSDRLQRPQPQDFNPFRTLIDPLNFRAGALDLKPQQTQAFELGYQFRRSPVLYTATLYARMSHDRVADVLSDLGNGAFLTRRQNIGRFRDLGLELVANGRLTKTLTYSLSGDVRDSELDDRQFGVARRDLATGSARGNLTWRPDPSDTVQLNGYLTGPRLTPQGSTLASTSVNLGYRRALDAHVSLIFTGQDLFGTFRDSQKIETAMLRTRFDRRVDSRLLLVGVVWGFGGQGARDVGFDLPNGGPG